ncbi:CC0125/CC1285 family lipoprotein [Hyphococcus luteus]|uniref:Lipoprotein n=1 Tax=Hyphococcus luteus TaxID=2058213 RepID=A0A2S7K3U0_9PROT|nr:hypothetical protein [Marinicaulis flavus]PQA87151.1 hypothetical protein CW354_14020 [Marinicaulis flavus]
MIKLRILAATIVFLGGCATGYRGPVYEQATSQYDNGYSETRIDSNRFQVRYRSVGASQALAEDWVLRRSAELTLDQKYDWFQITSRNRTFSDSTLDRYDQMRIYGRDSQRYPDRPQYDYGTDDSAVAQIEILMGNNPAPRSTSVYDARQVLDYRPQR